MRCLKRNKQAFYYAPYLRKEKILSEAGLFTGQHKAVYGSVKKAYGNISPANGETSVEMFGSNENYDKVIVLEAIDKDINENSKLWIDSLPYDADSDEYPHDYVVKKIAVSLNSIAIAVSKVNVNA